MVAKSRSMSIDLNADVGESFGHYRIGHDEALIPLVSSVNIACGFHAGDATTMRRSVELALRHDVAIGAHPGLPDLAGFGRREMAVSAQDVYDMMLYQVGALYAFVRSSGARLAHVKPHGALYHMANNEAHIAAAVVRAVRDLNVDLALVAPGKGCLAEASKEQRVLLVPEMFADRAYRSDGSLLPRIESNSVIDDPQMAVIQVVRVLKGHGVLDMDGRAVSLDAKTVCVHGDSDRAVQFVTEFRQALERGGVRIERYRVSSGEQL